MNQKPYLTVPFWMAFVSLGVLVGGALGLFTEQQGEQVKVLIEPVVAATLALVGYIISRSYVEATAVRHGVLAASNKPKWLTHQFWMAAIGSLSIVAVGLGVVDQKTATDLVGLLDPFILAVLPVLALLLGYAYEEAAAIRS